MSRFPVPFVLCTIVVLLLLSSKSLSQTGPDNTHIEVVVRPSRATSRPAAPVQRLKESDFQLSEQGTPIAVHLARSEFSYPKHLLIVTPSPLPPCPPLGSLRKLLQRLIAKGWIIQIADTNGAMTSALSDIDSLQATCNKAASVTSLKPIQTIENEPGRRIVVFTAPPNPKFLAYTIHAIPEIYSIDGGVPVSSHTGLLAISQSSPAAPPASETTYTVPCHPVGGRIAPNDPCNLGVTATYKTNGFSDGVMHERSMASALQDVLSNNRYYDLSFRLPSAGRTTTAPKFSIHYGGNLTLAISMYSDVNLNNSQRIVRQANSAKLDVAQR